MALIKCPECGKEISNKAALCPNCGCPRDNFEKQILIDTQTEISNSNTNNENPKSLDENQKNAKTVLPQSGLGIAGMIIGIIAILISCGFSGAFAGIIGLILSIGGIKDKNKSSGMAIAGVVLNSVAIFIFIIVMVLRAGIENKENNTDDKDSKMAPQELTNSTYDPFEDDIIDVDISDCHITYLQHEIVENMAGDKCVAVYYEFTNNSDESKTFDYTVSDKAFQDGIELETSLFHVNDDSKNSNAEIKPGVTITVCSGFVLRNEGSDIELEIGKWIALKDDPDDKMVLSIK